MKNLTQIIKNIGINLVKNPLTYISIAGMTLSSCNFDTNQKYDELRKQESTKIQLVEGSTKPDSNTNQIYEDFANFVQENSKNNYLTLEKNNHIYMCSKGCEGSEKYLSIKIYNEETLEWFTSIFSNGLDFYYPPQKHNKDITSRQLLETRPSKENETTFDSLIVNIPRWYKEEQKKPKNKKYRDFATFIEENNKLGTEEESRIQFIKNGKEYDCLTNDWQIVILIDEERNFSNLEYFCDNNFNGLDVYSRFQNNKLVNSDHYFQSEENKMKFDSLVENIPQWYEQDK